MFEEEARLKNVRILLTERAVACDRTKRVVQPFCKKYSDIFQPGRHCTRNLRRGKTSFQILFIVDRSF